MATKQATTQLHESDEMAAKANESSELLLFRSTFWRLRSLLESSYNTVSAAAFQEGLIDLELFTAVTNQRGYDTAKSQIMWLLSTLCENMQNNPKKAPDVLEKFLKILETEAVYDDVRKRLQNDLSALKAKAKPKNNPQFAAFQRNIVAMSGVLQGGLSSLATQCLTEGLISTQQMAILTNASAKHAQNYINQVLAQIEKEIIEDSDNLEVFITSVLEPMGKFAEGLIDRLRGNADDDEDDGGEPMEDGAPAPKGLN